MSTWLRSHRSQVVRGIEAFAALTALVVCYQAAWLILRGETDRLRHLVPNREVWLEPGDDWAEDDDRLPANLLLTREKTVSVAVTAPPGENLALSVNGIDRSARPIGRRRQRYRVTLRPGFNEIRARLLGARPSREPGWLWVLFLPPESARSLRLELLGFAQDAEGTSRLVGSWLPQSRVNLEIDGEYEATVQVDPLGLFALPVDAARLRRAREVRLRGVSPYGLADLDLPLDPAAIPSADVHVFTGRRVAFTARRTGELTATFEIDGVPRDLAERWRREWSPTRLAFALLDLDAWPLTGGYRDVPTAVEVSSVPDGLRIRVSATLPDVPYRASGWKASVRLAVQQAQHRRGALSLLALAGDEVRLDADPELVVWRTAATKVGGNSFRWGSSVVPPDDEPLFALEYPRDRATPAEADTPSTLAGLVERLRWVQAGVPEQTQVLLFGLLEAVPLIGLLWLAGGSGPLPRPTRRTLVAAGGALAVFHFLILTPGVYSVSFDFLFPLTEGLDYTVRDAVYVITDLTRVYPVWTLAAALLVGPIFRALRRADSASPRIAPWRRALARWLLFWPGVFVLPLGFVTALWWLNEHRREFTLFEPRPSPAWIGIEIAILCFAPLALAFFLARLLRAVLGRSLPRGKVVRASSAMLVLPLLPPMVEGVVGFVRDAAHQATHVYPPLLPAPAAPLTWAAIIAGVGAALLYHLSALAVRLVRWPPAARLLWPPWRGLWIVGLLAACVPMGWLLRASDRTTVEVWELQELGFVVDRLVPYLALLGLGLLIVRSNGPDRFQIPRTSRLAGTLVFAFYLAGRAVNLWFIPIPLLVGWVLFDRWVLQPRSAAPLPEEERAAMVRRILDWRRRQRFSDQLSKALEKSLEKILSEGKVSPEAARAPVLQGQHAAERARASLPGGLAGARQEVFGTGTGSGPWRNARTALRYGCVLAIPFVALGIAESGEQRLSNFPFLQLTAVAVVLASTWLTLAFLFGYFFHWIRGRDGLGKALTVSTALVAATVPFRLVSAQPLFVSGHLVEIIQLVLFVLLLALLAFDLRALRVLGFRRRDFLAVHGVSTSAGYLGSILLTAVASYLGSDLLPVLGKTLLGLGGG